MDESPLPSGGHLLGSSFSSEPVQRPRRRTGLIMSLIGVAVVGAACAGTHWAANVGYDDALVSFESTVADAEADRSRLDAALAPLSEDIDAASTVIGAAGENLMAAAARDALVDAAAQAEDAHASATALVDETLPSSPRKPGWAWELFGATAQLNTGAAEVGEVADELTAAHAGLMTASAALDETGTAAILSAAEGAAAFEAAHVSARNLDILALRRAAAWLSDSAILDTSTAEAYGELESAATAMLTSEQAELAEKQGSLYEARVEIEAFARGLAPGVLLDFDWAARVNGYGEADSMGGYATWWYGDPGYATIELSDTVAQYWPGDRSRALVAHEVGHAISVKCQGMYDDTDQSTVEAWATAWAISMGFHDDANGTSAYGAPPQSLIDAAAGCR